MDYTQGIPFAVYEAGKAEDYMKAVKDYEKAKADYQEQHNQWFRRLTDFKQHVENMEGIYKLSSTWDAERIHNSDLLEHSIHARGYGSHLFNDAERLRELAQVFMDKEEILQNMIDEYT